MITSFFVNGIIFTMTIVIPLIVVYLIWFERIHKLVSSTYSGICWLFRFRSKVEFKKRVESAVNLITKELSADIFDKRLKIVFLKEGNIYKESKDKTINVKVIYMSNETESVCNIISNYVTSFIAPINGRYLDKYIVESNKDLVIQRVIDRYNDDNLSEYYKDARCEIINKEYSDKLYEIERNNKYFEIYLPAINDVDKNEDARRNPSAANNEILDFSEFLIKIINKKPKEIASLRFTGSFIQNAIILVMKEETKRDFGIEAHLSRLIRIKNQGTKKIYLTGLGRENINDAYRIDAEIEKSKLFRKIKTYHSNIIKYGQKVQIQQIIFEYINSDILLSSSLSELAEVDAILYEKIPYIASGDIEILKMVREKGQITKVMLKLQNEELDIIECCIGEKERIKRDIEKQLANEKIDFILYDNDVKELIKNSLMPFKGQIFEDVHIKTSSKQCKVYVKSQYMGHVIGTRGVNVYLAETLIGWKIEILKYVSTNSAQ